MISLDDHDYYYLFMQFIRSYSIIKLKTTYLIQIIKPIYV
jgi:hypothetical protein